MLWWWWCGRAWLSIQGSGWKLASVQGSTSTDSPAACARLSTCQARTPTTPAPTNQSVPHDGWSVILNSLLLQNGGKESGCGQCWSAGCRPSVAVTRERLALPVPSLPPCLWPASCLPTLLLRGQILPELKKVKCEAPTSW